MCWSRSHIGAPSLSHLQCRNARNYLQVLTRIFSLLFLRTVLYIRPKVNWSFVNPFVRLTATCFVDVSPSIVTIFYMDMDMAFNATFNNISVIYRGLSVLLVEEARIPGETTDLLKVTDKLCHKILQDGEDSCM